MAAMASGVTALLALSGASAGAAFPAGVLLVLALMFAPSPAAGCRLPDAAAWAARSADEVRLALAPLQAEGWRLRHSLHWRGGGDMDSLAIAPTGVHSWSRRKQGRTTITNSLGCASRQRRCFVADGAGSETARCPCSASSELMGCNISSAMCLWFRSTG